MGTVGGANIHVPTVNEVTRYRYVIDIKIYTQCCSLGEDVTDLRFDLGVKSSTVVLDKNPGLFFLLS